MACMKAEGVVPETDLDAWFVREVLPLEAALTDFLRRNWRNASDISDLRQDIYVRVYEAAARELPRQIGPFVFSIARNLIIDRARRGNILAFDDIADFANSLVLSDEIDPERRIIARSEIERLRAALERLPPRCREVVALRKIEGASQREVAVRLGIAEGTVEKQLAKGIRMLADIMFSEASKEPNLESGRRETDDK